MEAGYVEHKKEGEIGEPSGVPTATGQKSLAASWNMSRHWRMERKDLIEATR